MDMKIKYIFGSVILGLFIFSEYGFTQTVTYDSLPSDYQLYPRDETDNDSAVVFIMGKVDKVIEYDSVIVEIDVNSDLWYREAKVLSYDENDSATINLTPKIYADTVNYNFRILFRQGSTIDEDITISNVVCGDVFLIEGQSNAEAEDQGGFVPYTVEWVRTFGSTVYDPSVSQDSTWDLGQAEQSVTHAFVGIWGLRLGKLIVEEYGIPVCIINGAVGGTDIQQHLPGEPTDLYNIYSRLLWRTRLAGVKNNVKALIWWQGESNTNKEKKADDYYDDFLTLKSSWQLSFAGINKIYTVQIHAGYSSSEDRGIFGCLLREYQRILAEDNNDTEIMTAHNLAGHDGAHFSPAGYDTFAVRIFRQIKRDFYNSNETININPPNISKAYFVNEDKDVLVLEFNNTTNLVWQNDTTISSVTNYLKDYFYFHNSIDSTDTSLVDTAQIFGNLLRLELKRTSDASAITYLPNRYYNGTFDNYQGPWLENSLGIPASSFFVYPIDSEIGDDPLPVTLSVFTAKYVEHSVKLKWRTESEINNLGFILLRKQENDSDYHMIASYENNEALKGKGTTTQPNEYEFSDGNIVEGETYYYILQDVDYNGVKTNHGPVIVTTSETNIPKLYNLYQNYPNPFNPSTTISFYIPETQYVTLQVFDSLGRTVKTLMNRKVEGGYYEVLFNPETLSSGIYYYKMQTENFSETKQMMLLK